MTSSATFAFYIDWDNDGSVDALSFEANETVTSNVLGVRTEVNFKRGRDGGRSLSGFLSADVTLELDNRTKLYSPDYAAGALFGSLGPGKPVRIRATSGTTRDIFRGFIDEYTIDPYKETRSVTLTCVDAFAHFADSVIDTILYEGIRTGEAIGFILDAIGWSGTKRDLDPGSTTLRQFWLENETASQAIKDVLESEGPPAICYVDGSGNFVFRDRSHRLVKTASLSSQATFRDTGSETSTDVNFSPPASYDVGFRDIVNSVSFSVEERNPTGVEDVFTTEDVLIVPSSGSLVVNAQTTDPFSDAITPVDGIDYSAIAGSVSSVSLSKTSGASTDITINAGASGATLNGIKVRATTYPVTGTFNLHTEDATSIGKYGRTSWTEGVPKWCGKNDAAALANIILNLRKDRLPVFTLTVKNANSNRLGQILDRQISDMVTIVEDNTQSNHTYYIESIEQKIAQVGKDHAMEIACERVPSWVPSAANVLILNNNNVGHRLDEGELGY